MTLGGAVFLVLSLAFVWGLAIFCYRRLLTGPVAQDTDQPDASEAEQD